MSVLVLVWILSAASAPPPDSGEATARDEGLALLARQEYAAAARLLEQASDTHPGDPALQAALGRAYLHLDKYQQALNAFSAILMSAPRHLEANMGRARALVGLGDAPKAVKNARLAVDLAPERAEAWLLLGDVYAHDSLQDHPRAVDAYRRALALDPESLQAAMGLARSLSYTREVEQAIEVLERARTHHPGSIPLVVKLAESYYAVRDLDRAESLVHEALEADPGSAEARRVLEQIEGRRAYNFWVPVIAIVAFPVLVVFVRWLKRGRTPKA